ncbi:MAG: hypothetical protein ACJA0I_000574, partial [Gammaproteobacteria bacterium]
YDVASKVPFTRPNIIQIMINCHKNINWCQKDLQQ